MKKGLTIVYIVRHGETDWNVEKKVMGHTDIDLNEKGVTQAKKLAVILKNIQFDVIFSSDLIRARRTAEIVVFERKTIIQTTKLLRERYMGRLEGKSWVNTSKKLKLLWNKLSKLNDQERKKYNLHKVENDNDVLNRFIPFIKNISTKHYGKNILIVTHGGLIRLLLYYIGFSSTGNDPDFAKNKKPKWINIHNTAYIKLESTDGSFQIKETLGIELITRSSR